MSHSTQDKRTKSQILRLLDHAMQQEEKLAEKIQTLENQLAECRKRAEDPRYEITESAMPASKVSFRLDYYRTEKKGPVKGIIEHLSSRETRSFGSDDGFDTIQQFVGKYLPVKARAKQKPLAPPSPLLEETPVGAALEPQPAATETTPTATPEVLEETPSEAQPALAANLEVLEETPAGATLEAQPAVTETASETVTLEVPEHPLQRSATPSASSGRLAARIRHSLSLSDDLEPGETFAADTALPQQITEPVAGSATNNPQRRLPLVPHLANERLAVRIRRSLSLSDASEAAEPQETAAVAMEAVQTVTPQARAKVGVFSVVTEDSDQHQIVLRQGQQFQLAIPALQVPDDQGKTCQVRLIAENLETGEQLRTSDTCHPNTSALRIPRRPMELPSGGYRLTAVLGSLTEPRQVFYQESRLVVVR